MLTMPEAAQHLKQRAVPHAAIVRQLFETFYTKAQVQKIESYLSEIPDLDLNTGHDWGTIRWDPETQKPPRLLILAGLGSMTFFKRMVSDPAIQKETHQMIFIENDPKVITHFLHHPEFLRYLASPSIRFIFGFEGEEFKAALFNLLKLPNFSKVMDNGLVFFNEQEPDEARKTFYANIHELVRETVFHVYHNYGQILDSIEGVKASIENSSFVLDHSGVHDLKDIAKGRAALLVAAGPGLDKDIKTIAKERDKFIIFAADAAVKPLLKAGITPDFCTSIERGNIYQRPFWEGLPKIDTQLVAFPVVHADVLSIYPGPKRCVYRNYAYYAYFEKSWPRKLMSSGGSTTHLAFRLAQFMGCSPIIMVGVDNAYLETSPGMYKGHADNLGYSEWAESHPIDYYRTERKHLPSLQVESFDGSKVMSNITYHQWAKELTEDVMVNGLEGQVYNTNPKAHKIPGIALASLEGLSASLESPLLKIDLHPKASPLRYRSWDHKILKKNLESWQMMAQTLIEICQTLQEAEIVYPETLAHLFQLHNLKFLDDDMFVSFVVQNCAAEFYRLQNRWYALSSELYEDVLPKIAVVKEHYKLYGHVIQTMREKLGWLS